MTKKNKGKNRNKKVKKNTNNNKSGQATAVKLQDNSISTYNIQPEKRYFGFTTKTWTILLILSVASTFIIFLVAPYTMGLYIATKNGNIAEFLSGINYFTIFLSILGTVASVLSIIMTLIDRKRYVQEKEHSEKLLLKLREVSVNVETIQAENHGIKLDLLQIKDTIKMSKEVKDKNTGDWADKEHSGEVNDDKQE